MGLLAVCFIFVVCASPLFVVILAVTAMADADEYENPPPKPVSYGVGGDDVIHIDSANWTGARKFPNEAYEWNDDVTKAGVDTVREGAKPFTDGVEWEAIQ